MNTATSATVAIPIVSEIPPIPPVADSLSAPIASAPLSIEGIYI